MALIDLRAVRRLLESHPPGYFQGLIPVDFAGLPVNLEKARQLADEFGLWVIEDSCHAPGGSFLDSQGREQRCGNGQFADLAIFSFHPVKHIATGEGGMITTNREDLYRELLKLRTHGITKDPTQMERNDGGWYMEMQELGYNYRMPDMLCALGISQLTRADEGLVRRRQLAARYDGAFAKIPAVRLLSTTAGHAYHLYVIQIETRKGLYDYLRERQVYAQVHYIPVHTMPYYQNLGWKPGDFPHAENYYAHCLSIPLYPSLSDEQQEYVIKCIQDFVRGQDTN
jgi:dTDP-4-amino-4,6-dideoxygalactose transaminase